MFTRGRGPGSPGDQSSKCHMQSERRAGPVQAPSGVSRAGWGAAQRQGREASQKVSFQAMPKVGGCPLHLCDGPDSKRGLDLACRSRHVLSLRH